MIREILFDKYDLIRKTDSLVVDIFLFVCFICLSCGAASSNRDSPV